MDKIIEKLIKVLEAIMLVIFGFSTLVIVAATVYGVVMRYVINNPVPWVEEVQMVLVVWMSFFGVCVTTVHKGNISISLLVDRFPKVLQNIIGVIDWCLVTGVIVIISWLEFTRLGKLLTSTQMTAVLHIPKYVPYAAVAVSCVVIFLCHCLVGIKDIRNSVKKEVE